MAVVCDEVSEIVSWTRRSPLSRWMTRFDLLPQWGVGCLAVIGWAALAGAAYAEADAGRWSGIVLLLAGVFSLPFAVDLPAVAIRNTWKRFVSPDRYARDRARAQTGIRHP